MKQSRIPPLGAIPRFVHDENRIEELQGAISRFIAANRAIPLEVVSEYNELVKKLPVEGTEE